MNIVYILIAILILGFIIMVHELGHYTVGRLCGLGIEEFSIGFGPKLVQWGKGIKYTLRALPIGGYVRFAGEDADSEDPRAFNNAPVWKRFLTTLEGELVSAKEEAAREFPQEQELAEKSARLAELNVELDKAERSKKKPAREESEQETPPAEKPSIRQQLKDYEAPAQVAAGAKRSPQREASL